MSQRSIREYDGKRMLSKWLREHTEFRFDHFVQVKPSTDLALLPESHPWLLNGRLVAKPDELIKRRGKAGLLSLGADWRKTSAWIAERRGQVQQVEQVSGELNHFLIEPFIPHAQEEEFYLCLQTTREGDEILFHHEGGVDVGDVDSKAVRMTVPVFGGVTEEQIADSLLKEEVPQPKVEILSKFIMAIIRFSEQLHFSYLEINPIVVTPDNQVIPLDMAAKIDETAKFKAGRFWGAVEFPPPFGRPPAPEEQKIKELDAKTGASLKLTILNKDGRIWTMVAGGGASVIYADTITDLGSGHELANYGEYSGAPSDAFTYEYAKTVIQLMLDSKAEGKVLIIGGGIANFTDVASTFNGIIRALVELQEGIREQNIRIYVRRGGPNYQEGLDKMRAVGQELNLQMYVFGPESHMTSVVSLALGKPLPEYQPRHVPQVEVPNRPNSLTRSVSTGSTTAAADRRVKFTFDTASGTPKSASASTPSAAAADTPSSAATMNGEEAKEAASAADRLASQPDLKPWELFHEDSRSLVYGLQPGAVQNMLDFDFICGRKRPSVAGLVYGFSTNHYRKFYWNTKEILLPIFEKLDEALEKNPDVDIIVNFSSFRSVFESTEEILGHPQIRTIAIIAEGVPERDTRSLITRARNQDVTIIGPATVGGISPGLFRIGNTGGMLDNIIDSRLYRPGSVAYVARSGGMSNELNNIIAQNADGVYEGIAIGGDRYPGTTFIDHLLRYEANPDVKMLVVLGEVGGVEEYKIVEAIKDGRLKKKIVAWCIGTCSKIFPYEVQFGHAGACASGQLDTADAKNLALREAGAIVPESFEGFGQAINEVYAELVEDGTIQLKPESPPPQIPVDFHWANKLGLVRKPSAFVSSIVDERGEELVYGGMKISEIFQLNLGIGGVVGLIWFRKRLPDYFCRFIEMVLVVTADHGPAVAGAHNTIVCARAGKDLVSSLVSGLLTIGPRFGGALDSAAAKFSWAYDHKLSPEEFVSHMRKTRELISGIGHKVKSLENPDVRVSIIKQFVRENFKSTEVFDYALEVEQVTTRKKSNLILNVDGAIACAFVDLLRGCGAFTREEADEYVAMGTLNGLFVLGRSIGFMGHYIDQKRLKQGLYRHPTEDISYLVGEDLQI